MISARIRLLSALLLALAPLGPRARADILFIDTNGAQSEIDAARRMAAQRGERLLVFPEMTDARRRQITAAAEEQSRVRRANGNRWEYLANLELNGRRMTRDQTAELQRINRANEETDARLEALQ